MDVTPYVVDLTNPEYGINKSFICLYLSCVNYHIYFEKDLPISRKILANRKRLVIFMLLFTPIRPLARIFTEPYCYRYGTEVFFTGRLTWLSLISLAEIGYRDL